MKRPRKVGILGAGRIAADFDAPGDAQVRTLAQAVNRARQFTLAGFFDRDSTRAAAAEAKWNCPPSPRDRAAWLAVGWDVICIATPDAAHALDLRDVLAQRPQAVLVEKPLAVRDADATNLLQSARRLGIPLLVDFPRREHSAVRHITELLHSGKLGKVRRIEGIYSGGLRHNGVHLLDLVGAWLPAVSSVRKLGGASSELLLELQAGKSLVPLLLAEATQPDCYVWELRVETDRARIELRGAPETLRLSCLGAHPNYPGFTTLVEERAWPMEDEPLLLRVVERLAKVAGSPAAARAQWKLELERQQFFNKVFARCER